MSDLQIIYRVAAREGVWLTVLFTLAVLLVGALRWPWRRLFGAEAGYLLWGLVPLACLVALLPHRAAHVALAPAVVLWLPGGASHSAITRHAAMSWSWPGVALASWSAGFLAIAWTGWHAQRRYRHLVLQARNAGHHGGMALRLARSAEVGPALIGWRRPAILLPCDFEQRYEPDERALVLAHEACHAGRRDPLAALIAWALLAIFWFHPLAWWAHASFRRDQELACDAAVMRMHPGRRRRYAAAMLKTLPAVRALPAGCTWARHPITERIAMLGHAPPPFLRRFAGLLLLSLSCAVAGAGYAAAPGKGAMSTGSMRLKITVTAAGAPEAKRYDQCLEPGRQVSVSGAGNHLAWDGRFTVLKGKDGLLYVKGHVHTRFAPPSGQARDRAADPMVATHAGQAATIQFGEMYHGSDTLQDGTVRFVLIPDFGC